jgi:hypothetical protein
MTRELGQDRPKTGAAAADAAGGQTAALRAELDRIREAAAAAVSLLEGRQQVGAERAALVRGLRDVAAFLEAHPDLPAPSSAGVAWDAKDLPEDAARAAVNAAAAALGERVFDIGFGSCSVYRSFGPVEYRAVYISDAAREASKARARAATQGPVSG